MEVGGDEVVKSKVVHHDPGWNDPPMFAYDAAKTASVQTGRRSSLLNKRVAFPLAGGVASPAAQSPSGAEPSPIRPPSMPPPGGVALRTPAAAAPATAVAADHNQALESGVAVLRMVLDSLPADDKREKEEIGKRLDVLQRMCEEDKLNPDVYGRLVQLAQALHSGEADKASHIQAGLMVDHVGLCTPWMAAVRLLVRHVAQPDA